MLKNNSNKRYESPLHGELQTIAELVEQYAMFISVTVQVYQQYTTFQSLKQSKPVILTIWSCSIYTRIKPA